MIRIAAISLLVVIGFSSITHATDAEELARLEKELSILIKKPGYDDHGPWGDDQARKDAFYVRESIRRLINFVAEKFLDEVSKEMGFEVADDLRKAIENSLYSHKEHIVKTFIFEKDCIEAKVGNIERYLKN